MVHTNKTTLVSYTDNRVVRYSRSSDGWYTVEIITQRETADGLTEYRGRFLRLAPEEIRFLYNETQRNKEED